MSAPKDRKAYKFAEPWRIMKLESILPSLAERCVQNLHAVPDMHVWAELCMEATVLEGAGPMLQAARLRMPLGHDPDVRRVMRVAASARMEFLQLQSRM